MIRSRQSLDCWRIALPMCQLAISFIVSLGFLGRGLLSSGTGATAGAMRYAAPGMSWGRWPPIAESSMAAIWRWWNLASGYSPRTVSSMNWISSSPSLVSSLTRRAILRRTSSCSDSICDRVVGSRVAVAVVMMLLPPSLPSAGVPTFLGKSSKNFCVGL